MWKIEEECDARNMELRNREGTISSETRAFSFTRPLSTLTVYSISRPPLSFRSFVFCWTNRSKSFRLGVRRPLAGFGARLDQLLVKRVHFLALVLGIGKRHARTPGAVSFTDSACAAASAARKSSGGGSTTFAGSAASAAITAAFWARSASTALAAAPKWCCSTCRLPSA